jgi:hypothetical protein
MKTKWKAKTKIKEALSHVGFLDRHPFLGRLFVLLVVSFFLVFCVISVVRVTFLIFDGQTTDGIITRFDSAAKSSSYYYQYEVYGTIFNGSELVAIPFLFHFYVCEHIKVVYSTSYRSISTPEAALSQDFVVSIVALGYMMALGIYPFLRRKTKKLNRAVEELDLKKQVSEFERKRQEKLEADESKGEFRNE